MRHKTLSLAELSEIARKFQKYGWVERKAVKLSSKEDIVDRTKRKSNELIQRLRSYY